MGIELIRQKASPILEKYRVSYAGLFGSQARVEARPDSDVDLLVRFEKLPSLAQFIRLESELKDALKTDVDLVTEGTVKPFINKNIQKDLTTIYGQG